MMVIVVQNVPGYGSLTLADQTCTIAPRDGSVVAFANNGMPTAPRLAPSAARCDPDRFGVAPAPQPSIIRPSPVPFSARSSRLPAV